MKREDKPTTVEGITEGDAKNAPPPAKPSQTTKPAKSRRRRKILLGLAIALPVSIGALWYAANEVPWVGAFLADTLRAVLGPDAVQRIEETAYGVQDRWNQWTRSGEAPKRYWDAPSATQAPPPLPIASATPATSASASASIAPPNPMPPPFHPADVGPVFKEAAAEGDGVWVPVAMPNAKDAPTFAYKTLLHPDKKRPWAELFVLALELRRIRLNAVAGTEEPRATVAAARTYERKGLIAKEHFNTLLAAMNGGFKEEHGHWGMKVDGVVLVSPRDHACAIAAYDDGSYRIGTWKSLADTEPQMRFYRQTPPCLVEGGKLHPALSDENTNWGAALGGDTVVRRSAMALDASHETLFVALSNATSARAMGVGMLHAGGADVAQLDINYSYPRIVLFHQNPGESPRAEALFPGFKFKEDDYIDRSSPRDFFYFIRTDTGAKP